MKTCSKAPKASPIKKSSTTKQAASSPKKTKAPPAASAQGRILGCLLREETFSKSNETPREKVAKLTAIKPSTFKPLVSKMKGRDMIFTPSPGTLGLTEKGRSLADPSFVPASNEDARKEMKAKHCSAGMGARVFDLLADGRAYKKSFVFEHAECKSKSTFAPLLSKLKGKGVIHYPTSDTVQLSDACFPWGRPETDN